LNKPKKDEYFEAKKTIVFQMEPSENRKDWGSWKNPDPNVFMKVFHHKNELNVVQWRFKTNYSNYSKNIEYDKKDKCCILLSSKNWFKGHKKRIELLKYIETQNIECVDIYGKENYHGFKNYKGKVPNEDPYEIYKQYKYVINFENNQEHNYATEKIWEPLLCDCLTFYWGCPNLNEYIDEKSFVYLEEDIEKSFQIIQKCLDENKWKEIVEVIRNEKKKVLEEYGLFSKIYKIINKFIH